ncbi:MAG: hypothetical protein WC956_00445 [bacterium]
MSEIARKFLGTQIANYAGMHLIGIALAVAMSFVHGPAAKDKPIEPVLPPVIEVQQRAIDYARIDLGEAAKWKKRARLAAYVPRLQLEYGRRLRNYVNVNVNDNVYVGSSGVVVGPEDGAFSSNQTADNSFGVRAIWELRDAVFNTDVLAASAEARNIARERNALIAEVNKRYYAIESTPAELALLAGLVRLNPRQDKAMHELFLRRVVCEESVAELDAFTGGWFSGQLQGPICETSMITKKEGSR